MGTQQGLVRYDGARFVTFDDANTPLLRNSFITDLAEAPDGTLWIATRGGVVVYRDGALAAAPRSLVAVRNRNVHRAVAPGIW
jgi:ligand-binding sensor domain-containing protein